MRGDVAFTIKRKGEKEWYSINNKIGGQRGSTWGTGVTKWAGQKKKRSSVKKGVGYVHRREKRNSNT